MVQAQGRASLYLVTLVLTAQVVCLWLSLDAAPSISILCAGASGFAPTASTALAYAFGFLHLSFGALLALGFVSLSMPRLRRIYLTATIVGMCLLPVQSALVRAERLTCDAL